MLRKILLVSFFILTLIQIQRPISFSSEYLKNSRNIEGEYIIEIDKIEWLTNENLYKANIALGMPESFDKTIKIWLSVPKEWDNQKNVKILSVTPNPLEKKKENENGNIIYFWDFNEKTAKEKLQIKIKFRFASYETFYEINPELIGKYNKQRNDYKFYTKTEKYIEITPEIQKLAKEIVGSEVNYYYQAQKIFNWIIENMSYKFPVVDKGVTNALKNRSGDCGEYSFVFIALCRSLGIPARMVLGGWSVPQKEGPHVWAEFYLPNYGWIPADPTVAQMVKNNHSLADYYFCHLDNKRIIYSKGNNIKLEPAYPEKFSNNGEGRVIFLQPSRTFIWGMKTLPEVREKLIIYE